MAKYEESVVSRAEFTAQSALSKGRSVIDRYVSPQQRKDAWTSIKQFADERPALTVFIIAQLLISGPAVILFLSIAVTAFLTLLGGVLFLMLVGTIAFLATSLGFALMFIVPTLIFTTFLATCFWFWILAAVNVFGYLRNKIPNVEIHADFNTKTGTGDIQSVDKSKDLSLLGTTLDHDTQELMTPIRRDTDLAHATNGSISKGNTQYRSDGIFDGAEDHSNKSSQSFH